MGCGLMACSSDSDDGNGSGNGGGTPPGEIESVKGEMPTRTNSMKVYAHFMPWFEKDATCLDKGKWGRHWTMNAS